VSLDGGGNPHDSTLRLLYDRRQHQGVDPMTITARAAMFGGVLAALVLVSAPAAPQSPPADMIAAARELVAASRAGDQIKTLLPLMFQQIKPMIVQNRPEVERDFDKLMPLMLELMNARMEEFAEGMALIYARNFTVEELRQIQAFYHTPAGQKLLDRMPTVAQESMVLGQKVGQAIGKEVQGRMIEELRKRGHNI
jgi:hypothetical protein